MPAPQYIVKTEADVALVAATLKYVLGIKSGAAFGLELLKVGVAFFGTSPTNEPVLVELCYSTWATNSPGTASTSVTPQQVTGRVLAHGTTAAKDWSSTPTAITVLDEFALHPQQSRDEWLPIDSSWDCGLSEGYVIRMTAPNAVDVRAKFAVRRC